MIIPKKVYFVFLLFWIQVIYAINIYIVDSAGVHVPFVVVQSDFYTTLADSLGIVSLDNLFPNTSSIENSFQKHTVSFSRLGFQSIQATIDSLIQNPTVIMQKAPIQIDEFVVSSGYQISPFRMSTATRKVNIENLNRHYSSIEDVLNDVQNIYIRGIKLSGERQTVSLGGHHSRHTIIMLDNIVLNPSGQAVDLSSIPFSEIESIEIVNNNVSVETGSGGIAGMLILHTKKNSRLNQISSTNSIGSFGSIKQNVGLKLWLENIGFSFNVSVLNANNDFDYKYRDQIKQRNFNKKSVLNISSDLQYQIDNYDIKYSLYYQKFHNQLPGPINQEMVYLKAFQEGDTTHQVLSFLTKFKVFSFPVFFETHGYQIDTKSTYDNTKAPLSFYHAKNENSQIIQGLKSGIKNEFLVSGFDLVTNFGAEYKKEIFMISNLKFAPVAPEYQMKIDGQRYSTQTSSLFVSKAISKDFYLWKNELIGSYRYDKSSHFREYNSWRTEFNNYFFTYFPFQIKSSLGNAYMLPSFFELYWKGDSQTEGNPDLLPERSLGYRIECVLETNPSLGVAKWTNSVDNLIFWNRSVLGWKPLNLQSAEIDSWEIFGKYVLFKKQGLSFNYNRVVAKDKTIDKYLVWTPSFHWDVQLNVRIAAFSQDIIFFAQGKQWTTPDQLIPPLKGYETWSTKSSIDFRLSDINASLSLFVYNLLDKRFENYPYLPEPGRHWEMQISFRL